MTRFVNAEPTFVRRYNICHSREIGSIVISVYESLRVI